LTIRPMLSADISAISAWMAQTPLWQRYRLTEEAARRQLEAALAREDLLLTADSESGQGKACGLAWVVRTGGFGRSPYLRILGVSAPFRGQGAGAALLKAVEEKAAQGARELFLLVSDFNVPAQQFYLRQGYVQIGAIPGYVLPEVAELLFWKRLAPSM
jgi:ribosomal protein S18 acetylase RimI-like enzyme